jgi:hypothetical protein
MVRAMRGALEDKDDALRFDAELADLSGGDRYQQAASFLARNRGQDLVNRVIRLAVLAASPSLSERERRSITADEARLRDLETDGIWKLDPGVAALGELLVRLPADVRGPVITTNFDPLVEVAVRRANGTPNTQYFDGDGTLLPSDQSGTIDVAHVHGFWRSGDTLHTIQQLTAPRPELDGSLREALRGHVVVVAGYSGWSDAFSKSLLARISERQSLGMEVIWCAYQNPSTSDFESGILGTLSRERHTTFYGGIDVNEAFPALLGKLNQAGGLAEAAGPGLRGWTSVTQEYLSARAAACDDPREHREKFFNGLEPDWATAKDTNIPRLKFAKQLTGAVKLAVDDEDKPPFVVGVGLLGEGKSIALRQCVADAAQWDQGLQVLWREPGARLNVTDIMALPQSDVWKYLLASDDADLLIDELRPLAEALRTHGRRDIHFVGVAQERDWRNAGGPTRLSSSTESLRAGGLSMPDANAIVDSWAQLGTSGLGELTGIDKNGRGIALHEAARDASTGAPDSLMGAMLRLRFGDGLVDRVGDLLGRLDNHGSVGDSSLTECFLMISLMHTASLSQARPTPISQRLIAGACSLDEVAVEYLVLDPLGAEAAISRHSADVWVRHAAIADAALEASRKRDPQEITRAVARLVRTAVRLSPLLGSQDSDLYAAAYISRTLKDPGEAITAADAAALTEPRRQSYAVSRVTAHRVHGRTDDAIKIAADAWDTRNSLVGADNHDALLDAWATAYGVANNPAANLVLHVKMLSGHLDDLSHPSAVRALLGMGVCLTSLHERAPQGPFASALGGVVTLLASISLSGIEARYRGKHETTCESLGIELPVPNPWPPLQAAVDSVLATDNAIPTQLKSMGMLLHLSGKSAHK